LTWIGHNALDLLGKSQIVKGGTDGYLMGMDATHFLKNQK
jgi:hypothetical protein